MRGRETGKLSWAGLATGDGRGQAGGLVGPFQLYCSHVTQRSSKGGAAPIPLFRSGCWETHVAGIGCVRETPEAPAFESQRRCSSGRWDPDVERSPVLVAWRDWRFNVPSNVCL